MNHHQSVSETTPGHAPPCVSLFDGLQPHIKTAYARFALVSHDDHLRTLDPDDSDTLIVSSNWLLWQQLAAAGRHCVYFELGLIGWDPDDSLIRDLFFRSNAWIPGRGKDDPTLFHGISLARLFGPELSMFLRNYYRLERALRKLIERFGPSEILFFDYIYDVSVIDAPIRKRIAEDVARSGGVAFIDRAVDGASGRVVSESVYVETGNRRVKDALASLYAFSLETMTRLRTIFAARDRRVLFLVNSNMAEPLLNKFDGGLTPTFIGRTVPRKAGLLARCLLKGFLLVRNDKPRLSAADAARLDDIERDLEAALVAPAEGELAFQRAYVLEQILRPGRFRNMAREVLAAELMFDRIRPARIVVDGVRNPPPRVVIEIARNHGIPVDYTWHSPHTPQRLRYEALGGDPDFEPCVTRALSWGRINDLWLDRVDGPAERAHIGSPLMSKYTSPDWKPAAKDTPPERTNVLLLQYAFNLSDFAGLNANMYEAFVRTVRDLRKRGYINIRYKLHPGRGRWKKGFFEEIAAYFKLGCPVLKSEPYRDCLAWSDVVIGSALSGAMFETLAAGRPYVGLLLTPHSMDESFYEGFPMCAKLDEIPAALNRDIETESRRLLADIYGTAEFADPAKRLWDVLRADFE